MNGVFVSVLGGNGSPSLFADCINSAGHLLLEGPASVAFLDVNGVLSTIHIPGSSFTAGGGINDSDQIAGYYFTGNGDRGYLAAAAPEPASILLTLNGMLFVYGIGTGSLFRRRRR